MGGRKLERGLPRRFRSRVGTGIRRGSLEGILACCLRTRCGWRYLRSRGLGVGRRVGGGWRADRRGPLADVVSCGAACRARKLDWTGDRGRPAGRAKGARRSGAAPGQTSQPLVLHHGEDQRPLALRLSAGNENERRHLLPLIDELIARALRPGQVWADRGYDSNALEQGLLERGIDPQISRRRRAGDPIPAGAATPAVWRGRKRQTDPRLQRPPPLADRTDNAWLKAKRRIATPRPQSRNYTLVQLR